MKFDEKLENLSNKINENENKEKCDNETLEDLHFKNAEVKKKIKDIDANLKRLDEEYVTVKEMLDMKTGNEKELITNVKCLQEDTKTLKSIVMTSKNKENGRQIFKCKECTESFDVAWMLEKHLDNHSLQKEFKCDECEKEFHLKWRLKKHILSHQSVKTKYCHYYNNKKTCPFTDIGCKFLHKTSEVCLFGDNYTFVMCQYRH